MKQSCCKNCAKCKTVKGLSGPKYICLSQSYKGEAIYSLNGIYVIPQKQHNEYVKPTYYCDNYLPKK